MSRIGKQPIPVRDGVTVTVADNNVVTAKGPKGELRVPVDPDLSVRVEGGEVLVDRPTEQQRHRAMHGLYRSLIDNAVVGVTEGYRKQLEVIGVGYRAEVSGGVLELALGFSHPIFFLPPDGITITTETAAREEPHDHDRGHRQADGGAGGGQDPRPPPAGALQGQGRPLRRRVRPPQGRQDGRSVTAGACAPNPTAFQQGGGAGNLPAET